MNYIEEFPILDIEIIDKQHFELVEKGNILIKMLEQHEAKGLILEKYDDFINTMINHFNTEEQLFETFNYSESTRHIEMHKFFLESLEEPKNNYSDFDVKLSVYIINFLNNWAKNHISSFDVTFAEEYKKSKSINNN